jgi:thioredoxin-dependent peroxiredoxin
VLAEGVPAPDFTLSDQHGQPVSLADFRGRWLALWWFPKAFTSGWTNEGRGFRDRAPEFEQEGVEILGISFDVPEDNRAFAEKNGFPFCLLSDVDRSVGAAYETVRGPEESSPDFAKRRTYLIDPDGVIRKAYRVRDIPGHPEQVLEDFRQLSTSADG